MTWLRVEINSFNSLGIAYSNNYDEALNINWDKALTAIQVKIRSIINHKLPMYHITVMINSVILSKLLYVLHAYPLPMSMAKQIIKKSVSTQWGKTYHHCSLEKMLCLVPTNILKSLDKVVWN